eukprot:CAMPEP_0114551690 /NCGR_PEP_ID=MMETSP0114-20121206/6736_1 /TAXON_ID=31324 /ORGANISM="Goniomonas sp, Strain m" /LENGTH=569 /DNA_ID=CAMNT_0001736537 /DNA_START=19 /DNA_END=1728 /DNA_ORIENTATION=-
MVDSTPEPFTYWFFASGVFDQFIEPSELKYTIQIVMLMVVYAYVLFQSSNLISEGSELLLLIPSLAGIVGSIVLPVLGAVPDGAIVLFSGFGPKDQVQEQLAVGVGALAGSTIMLLTIPWCLSIFAGRVSLDADGEGNYKRVRGEKDWVKLRPEDTFSLTRSGINVQPSVAKTGRLMIFTTISYVIIQGPAFALKCWQVADKDEKDKCVSEKEKYWALAGLLICVVLFVVYLVYQVFLARTPDDNPVAEAKQQKVRSQAISKNLMSLSGVFGMMTAGGEPPLLSGDHTPDGFKAVLKKFFTKYDKNGDKVIDRSELRLLMIDLHEPADSADKVMEEMDTDRSGTIDFNEFCVAMQQMVESQTKAAASGMEMSTRVETAPIAREEAGDDQDDEEEDVEVPEDLAKYSHKMQQLRILLRASWQMGLGTLLVLLFSDPMVGVLSEFGTRINVSPFYISFVLAPLASNASELIASYNYALKKTSKTITISFAALEGAACMNNTFCLAIFLALVYARNLLWEFSAETISILFVQAVMFLFSCKRTHRLLDGVLVVSLYPISLFLVAGLEKAGLN